MESVVSLRLSTQRIQDRHFHDNIELIYVIEGQLAVTLAGMTSLLGPEDFMVINPNDIHEVHSYEKVFFAEITIDYAAASRCFDHHRLAFSCNSSEQPSHYYDGLRQIIRRLLGYSQSVLKQDRLMKEALGNELLYILIQHFLAAKAPAADGNVLPAQGEARVHSLLQYIMANY